MRFPVYVLVTKSDLLAGFSEFFADARQGGARAGVGLLAPAMATRASTPRRCRPSSSAWSDGCTSGCPNGSRRSATRPGARCSTASPSSSLSCESASSHFVEATFAPTKFEADASRPRRLLHERHPGRQPDRPRHGRARPGARARAKAPAGAASERPELFPHPPPARGRVPRGRSRRPRSARGSAAASCSSSAPSRRRRRAGRRHRSPGGSATAQNRAYLAEVAAQFGEVKKQVAAVRAGARSDLAALLPTLTRRPDVSPRRRLHPTAPCRGPGASGSIRAASSRRRARPPTGGCSRTPSCPRWPRYLEQIPRAGLRGQPGRVVRRSEDLRDAVRPEALQSRSRLALVRRTPSSSRRAEPRRRRRSRRTSTRSTSAAGWIRSSPGTTSSSPRCGRSSAATRSPNRDLRTTEARADPRPSRLHHCGEGRPQGPAGLRAREPASRSPRACPALYTKDGYYKHFSRARRRGRAAAGRGGDVGAGHGAARRRRRPSPKLAEAVKRLYLEDYRAHLAAVRRRHHRDPRPRPHRRSSRSPGICRRRTRRSSR